MITKEENLELQAVVMELIGGMAGLMSGTGNELLKTTEVRARMSRLRRLGQLLRDDLTEVVEIVGYRVTAPDGVITLLSGPLNHKWWEEVAKYKCEALYAVLSK